MLICGSQGAGRGSRTADIARSAGQAWLSNHGRLGYQAREINQIGAKDVSSQSVNVAIAGASGQWALDILQQFPGEHAMASSRSEGKRTIQRQNRAINAGCV